MVRTGRPPSDDSKHHRIITRMSAEELEKLNFCCTATGKTKSEIIREGIDKVYQELKAK